MHEGVLKFNFTDEEISQIKSHGLSIEDVTNQLYLLNGFSSKPKLLKAATIDDGIIRFDETEEKKYLKKFNDEEAKYNFVKFVPASGAATRMFKSLNLILQNHAKLSLSELKELANKDKNYANVLSVITQYKQFAFAQLLDEELPAQLEEDVLPFLGKILSDNGLSLSDFPKALIPFHLENSSVFTPVEEHLRESSELFTVNNRIHFTVGEQHENKFKEKLNEFNSVFSHIEFNVEYSYQAKTTDTVAIDKNGNIAKDDEGNIIFRPGGHGALINNLDLIDADFIYINNIDNIAHSRIRADILKHKKALSGLTIAFRDRIFSFLRLLENEDLPTDELEQIENYCNRYLFISAPENLSNTEKREFFFDKLNRPLRVCGMVLNEGEPGGGPFWVKDKKGEPSLQIVEKSQIDISDPEQAKILATSTHFNPVDMVCSVKNYHWEKFNLLNYVNKKAVIVTEKVVNGKEIKVLELPGLWNGAMFDWLTVFVEVPIATFNPVKEVTDLLKDSHQPSMD
jgi:hypothetical protein